MPQYRKHIAWHTRPSHSAISLVPPGSFWFPRGVKNWPKHLWIDLQSIRASRLDLQQQKVLSCVWSSLQAWKKWPGQLQELADWTQQLISATRICDSYQTRPQTFVIGLTWARAGGNLNWRGARPICRSELTMSLADSSGSQARSHTQHRDYRMLESQ